MFTIRHVVVVTVLCLLLTSGKGAAKAAPLPYLDTTAPDIIKVFDAAQRGLSSFPEYRHFASSLAHDVVATFGTIFRTVSDDTFRATVLSVFIDNPRWSNQLQVNTLRPDGVTDSAAVLKGVVINIPKSLVKDKALIVRAFDFDSGERRPLRLLVASSSDAFEVKVTGLTCNTRYSYRAVLAYKDGLTRGYNQSFVTGECK